MKKKPKYTSAALLLGSIFAASTASAAVINLLDHTAVAGTGDFIQSLGTTISNDPALYMVGTITWQANATNAEATANFHLAGNQERGGFGSRAGATDVMLDGGIETVGTGRPNGLFTVSTTPGVVTSYTFVLKIDQTNNTNPGTNQNWLTGNPNMWLWIDPDLGASEGSQAADITGWWSSQTNFTQVFYNHGTNTPNGDVVFSDFSVHYDGDTPFGASTGTIIPEPSTALLAGLGMLALLRRRR